MLKIKKTLSLLLSTILIMSSAGTAFAMNEKNNYGSDEHVLVTFQNNSELKNENISQNIVVTYEEDTQGNHQIRTYEDGELIEVNYGGIGATQITTEKIENGKVISTEITEVISTDISTPIPYAYRKEGTIKYTNPWTSVTSGIDLYLDTNKTFKETRVKKGYYSFAKLTSYFVSAWALPALSVKAILPIIFGNIIIEKGLDLVATKIVEGHVYIYTWKGVPTDTSRGKVKYLDGLKVEYKDKKGKDKVYRENYQADAFKTKNLTFGRMMLYKVYGIDEHPTTWK